MTETETEEEVTLAADEPDPMIPVQLRTYGLSGEPLRWAPSNWQPVVAATRTANVGDLDVAAVQPLIDATFPDAGYQATDVCLAHKPVGDFTATVTDNSVRVDLAGDVDLLLPDGNVEWDFGDRSPVIRDAGGWDHPYDEPGTYPVSLTVLVAGRVYGSSQEVEVGEAPPPAEDEESAEVEQVSGATTQISPGHGMPESEPGKLFMAVQPGEQTGEAEEEFDPADHTIDEVIAYLDEHPDDLGSITSAEENGKARVTLLEKLYARQE